MREPYDWQDQDDVDFQFFKMMWDNYYSKGDDILPRPRLWRRIKRAFGLAMVQYGQAVAS